MMNRLMTLVVLGALMLSIGGISAFAAESTGAGGKSADTRKAAVKNQTEKAPLVKSASSASGLVDLNFATKEQLMTLPGITEAYAEKIITGRPYREKSLLTRRKIIPLQVFYDNVEKFTIDLDKLILDEKKAYKEKNKTTTEKNKVKK